MIHAFFGFLGIALSLLRYTTYIRAIIRGTTKPHALTWLGAGLMAGIAAAIQYKAEAGPAVWVTGFVAVVCIGIGIAAVFHGEKRITRSDWASFFLALIVIPIWLSTKNAALALCLVLLIEILNYYPTVRKSYAKPQEEDALSWGISSLRWFCATLAAEQISPDTVLYPLFIALCESGIVAYLLWRRRQKQATIA